MSTGEKIIVTMLPIPRDDIEHPSEVIRNALERLVGGFAATCVKEGKIRKITLTISGYDNDPRELYEIPEVCAWARYTIKLLPSLLFFLDDDSQYRFVGWLCGPVSRKEIESRQFQERFQETRTKRLVESTMASSQFLERAGATTQQISTFYLQDMHRLAGAQAQRKRWWQFWK